MIFGGLEELCKFPAPESSVCAASLPTHQQQLWVMTVCCRILRGGSKRAGSGNPGRATHGKQISSLLPGARARFSLSEPDKKANSILEPAGEVLHCGAGGDHQAAAQQGALIHQRQGFPSASCLHLLLSLAGTLSENKRLLPRVKGLAFIKMIILFT